MSFETFVTEELAKINDTLSAISENSKKIEDLPPYVGNLPSGGQVPFTSAGNTYKIDPKSVIDTAIEAQITGSTIISGVTTSSPVPLTGNIHAIGIGPGTYPNWDGIVIPANNTGTLQRVDGVYSVSLMPIDLSGKLNVSDVIDNLSSTDEDKPLSAKQGKVLEEKKSNLVFGKNRFNWQDPDVIVDSYINYAGVVIGSSPGWVVSGYIYIGDLITGSKIICNKTDVFAQGYNFYDKDKVRISTVTSTTGIFTIPSNAAYFRIHIYVNTNSLSTFGTQVEIGNVSTAFEDYFFGIPEVELGKSVLKSKIKDDFTSVDYKEVLSAPKGKNLNDRLVINEAAIQGTQFEVLLPANIVVENLTYSIGSTGTVTGTKTGGRIYPFFRVPLAQELKFYANNSAPFIILGGDATSIIAIGICGGAVGLLYRFTNTNSATQIGSISIGSLINDTICRVSYKVGTYKIYSNDILKATILSTDLTAYSESLKPILGLVIYEPFTSIPDLTAIVNDRVGYIENKVKSILPNPFKGQKYTSLGDSIEAANITQPLLIDALELGTFQNLAISGTTLLNNGATSGVFKYLEVITDAKLITCNLGTNDFGISLPLGALGDTTNGTFYGALKIVTEGLVANHPLARIFFYTIQQRNYLGGGGNAAGMTNSNGNTVEQFNEAIKIMCRKASIPVIDLYQDWGVSLQNIGSFTYDNLHPNTEGHNRRARVIIEKIKQYGL